MRISAFLLLYFVSLIIKLQKAILLLKFLVVVFTHEINKEEEDRSAPSICQCFQFSSFQF